MDTIEYWNMLPFVWNGYQDNRSALACSKGPNGHRLSNSPDCMLMKPSIRFEIMIPFKFPMSCGTELKGIGGGT